MNKTETMENTKPDVKCQYFDVNKKLCTHPNYSRITSECRAFTRKAR